MNLGDDPREPVLNTMRSARVCDSLCYPPGHAYEKEVLLEWFKRNRGEAISPANCNKMKTGKTVPADSLRIAIRKALQEAAEKERAEVRK